jgi:hypothetical protein
MILRMRHVIRTSLLLAAVSVGLVQGQADSNQPRKKLLFLT